MAFERYVAEEIAADAVDGFISRREALRRLLLIGVSASAASALLVACGDDDDDDEASDRDTTSNETTGTTAGSSTTASTGAAAPAEPAELITFAGPDGQLTAAFAAAAQPKASVLIIHENKGLTDHFRALPKRLAGDGYNALAVDLVSREGGTAKFTDQAQATAALTATPKERLVADLQAGLDELTRKAPLVKLGVMGFCFGGGMTWSLLAAGEGRVAAAVPFYGFLPEGADFTEAKAAVLAIYAELDARVNETREPATAALKKAGLTHEVKTFPGVDHAFFNDTGPRYNAAAAAEAYKAVLDWFGQHLT